MKRGPRRKDAIVLAAAQRAFVQYGYAGTSMDAIAEMAGVSKRTVYSNFPTKEQLYAQVIEKLCASVVPAAIEGDPLEVDPEVVLHKVSVAFLEALYQPEQVAFYQTVVADSRQFPDVGRMLFDGPITTTQRVFEQYFRALARQGVLRLMDFELAAAQFVALLKVNIHLRLLLNQPTRLSHRARDKVARDAVSLFLHGALTPGTPRRASSRR
jgi:TetR/AcrR family transcriptional regulator, mexJK operon transcriptional repressor